MALSPNDYARVKELDAKRHKAIADARSAVDAAEKENRSMTADENTLYKRGMSEADDLKDRMDKIRELAGKEEDEDRDEEDEDRDEEDEDRDEEDEEDEEDGEEDDEDDEDDERGAKKFVIKGGKKYILQKRGSKRTIPGAPPMLPMRQLPGETRQAFDTRKRRSSAEYRRVFWDYFANGPSVLATKLASRAIQADSDIVGGYLIAPQEFVASLIKFVNNLLFVRQYATVYTVKSAQSLGAPSLDTDPTDAVWSSELDTGNEDTSMSFGKRELTPRPLALREKVSNKLLRMVNITAGVSADGSAITGGAEALVRDRIGYKFTVAQEKAFLLGTGGNQPLGLFTASNMGIDTSRDITTANAGSIVGDDLISAKYNQKVQYWPRMKWIFNRVVLEAVRKLKDSQGQYLWVPGGFGGESDTLLDIPVLMSEYAPSTIASGDYVGLLGDLSFYWIADSLEMQILRLVELYAAANQTGFIARMELDGMPVLAEAFTRIKVQ